MKIIKFLRELLVVDSRSGHISHTKFWSNIGHAVACTMFVYTVLKGNASVELWFVFGSLVMGNATAHKILNYKYGSVADKNQGEVK